MRIETRQIFFKGQFKEALVLTPKPLSFRYKLIASLVGVGLISLSAYLWTLQGVSSKPRIGTLAFGLLFLVLALFRQSFEVIQEREIRKRISFGPLSIVVLKTPLHAGFFFSIETNETNEILLIANHGSPDQLEIGPFDTEEQAEEVLTSLQFLDLKDSRNQDERSERAKSEVAGITQGIRPLLPRTFQFAFVVVVLLAGLIANSSNSLLFCSITLLFGIGVCELRAISTTIIEKVSPDYEFVKFSQRYRFLWKDSYSKKTLDYESPIYLGRSFNQRSLIPIALFLISFFLLNLRSEKAPKPVTTARPFLERSEQDQEALERASEILGRIQELRKNESQKDESPMKTDWTKLITEHHAWAHADGTYELVLGSPASAEELDKTEKQLGIHFPKEFRTLYQTHNGFGFSNKGGDISWSFMPLEQLPRFINRVRFYIEDDFPDEAAKFFPFFNWHDGGGTGYLLNEKGKLERRIYDFHPEQISKSYREMGGVLLEPGDKSIRQFLSLR